MLQLLILLGFAYAQDNHGQNYPTYLWALVFGVVSSLLSLLMGSSLVEVLTIGAVLTLYAWGYFAMLRQCSDNTLLWLLICVGGLAFPFMLPMAVV